MTKTNYVQTPEELEKILNSYVDLGILSQDAVALAMKKLTKQQIQKALESHPYAIYQGDRGRWMTYVKDDTGKRKLIAKTSRDDLEKALVDYYSDMEDVQRLKKMTFEDLYPLWIEKKGRRPNSKEYITRISSDWNRYYVGTDFVSKPVIEMDKEYVKDWAETLILENGLTTKQYSNAITILKQVLSFAEEQGIIERNPFDSVHIDCRSLCSPPEVKTGDTEVYTESERAKFYELAMEDFENEVHYYRLSPLASMFMFETGLRIGEVCAVRYEDIQGSEIIIRRMLKRDRHEVVPFLKRRNVFRKVPLTSKAKELIELARKYQTEHDSNPSGYIFSMDDEPANYRSISKCFTKYSKKCAGITKSSHKARKTYISILIDDENVSNDAVREAAGHRSLSTTFESYYFDRQSEKRSELFEKALNRSYKEGDKQ